MGPIQIDQKLRKITPPPPPLGPWWSWNEIVFIPRQRVNLSTLKKYKADRTVDMQAGYQHWNNIVDKRNRVDIVGIS